MTTEVKTIVRNALIRDKQLTTEQFNDVMEALEKQVPKKPDAWKGKIFDGFVCTKCNTIVFYDYKYCKRCGQAIDWSEVE